MCQISNMLIVDCPLDDESGILSTRYSVIHNKNDIRFSNKYTDLNLNKY